MKKDIKGISLVSLVITIAVMLIISTTTISISLDRFQINNMNRMINDIKFLKDKISNYYLEYNYIPIVRDNNNNGIKYTYTTLEFDKNISDNENYYIIDLAAMEGINLNYGKEGFNNLNASDDVYIINEESHTIYYVKGIEFKGKMYHTILEQEDNIEDKIPPTKPEIKVISGTMNSAGKYISDVEIEIVPGKDSWLGIEKTTYSINDGAETDIEMLTNNILKITGEGTYVIKSKSYDKKGNVSENASIEVEIVIE